MRVRLFNRVDFRLTVDVREKIKKGGEKMDDKCYMGE